MEKDYKVYMHIFPDGKKYIGITKNDPERRWNNGAGYSENSTMKKAIQEVGWENVESVIVKEGLTVVEASELEIELISAADTTNPEKGYNHHSGGMPYKRAILEEKIEKLESDLICAARDREDILEMYKKLYDCCHETLGEIMDFSKHCFDNAVEAKGKGSDLIAIFYQSSLQCYLEYTRKPKLKKYLDFYKKEIHDENNS